MSGEIDTSTTTTTRKNESDSEDRIDEDKLKQNVELKVNLDIETDIQKTENEVKVKDREEGDFKVYIKDGEMERIHEWVKLKPDIETGGDLFGLWIDKRTAVVQFVLGPGKKCRRTMTSFFQDTDYLKLTGEYFTNKHGLCNIGQWHSHHKIPLFEPSDGDCRTVCDNMPVLGMERYIVVIANETNIEIKVNCFLFASRISQEVPYQTGEFKILPGESPLRLNTSVLETINNSAEDLREEDIFPKSTDKNTEIKEENETGKIHEITEADRTIFVNNDKNTTTNNNDKSTKGDNGEVIELTKFPSALLLRKKDVRPEKNMNTSNDSKQEQLSTANKEKEGLKHVESVQIEHEQRQGSAVINQPASVEEGDEDRNPSNIIANRPSLWVWFKNLFSC